MPFSANSISLTNTQGTNNHFQKGFSIKHVTEELKNSSNLDSSNYATWNYGEKMLNDSEKKHSQNPSSNLPDEIVYDYFEQSQD